MYTSDIKSLKKQAIVYLIVSIFLLIFIIVYEHFSNYIYSWAMRMSFIISFVLGSLVSMIIYKVNKYIPSKLTVTLYNSTLATFIMFCIIQGVLKIFGTINLLTYVYIVVGIALGLATLIALITDIRKKEK